MLDPLTLDDRQQLTDLVSRYASCVDRRDFAGVGALFTVDAVLVTPGGERSGREDIGAAMRGLERYDRTFHLVGQTRHWREGADTYGETYCVAHHFTGGSGLTSDHVMFIRYDDTFVRADAWQFARRALDVVSVI